LAVLTGVASLGFVVIGSAAMGIAQGREEHVKLSIAFIANSASRALGGILGVVVLQSVTGVGFGVLIGCAIGAAIAYQLIAPKTFSLKLKDGISIEFGHVAHALIVLFTLTNIDVLLARVFLTEDLSGEYSVGVLLAKIAFFLPNAIIIVLFPKMSGGGSHRALYIATGLTAMVGVVITLASVFAGDLIIAVLGGSQYKELGGEAWLFALEGSAFALVQVLLYSRLAAQDRRAVLAVWGLWPFWPLLLSAGAITVSPKLLPVLLPSHSCSPLSVSFLTDAKTCGSIFRSKPPSKTQIVSFPRKILSELCAVFPSKCSSEMSTIG